MDTATLSGQTSNGARGGVRRLVTLLVAGSLAASGLVALDAVASSSVQAAVDCNPAAPMPGADALPLLQAAVDGCDEVRLGEGDYPLSNSLVVRERPNVTIRGVGKPGAVDPNSAGGSRIMLGAGVRNVGVVSIGGASPVTVTIDGVTIMGGLAKGNGGGISVATNARLDLKNSTVRNNKATEGAGIENNGTLFVTSSTFLNNEASKKGGGIRSQGTATIVNSTFQGNSASQGGAISSPGSGKVVHSTITKNFSTSSSSAGLDRNGGSLQVFYSIIGDNTRTNGSPAADCSGTPDLIGLNLVTNSSGCNPVGPIGVVAPGVLGLDPLAANGGPTLTRAVQPVSSTLTVSPALDRIEKVAPPATACVSTAVLVQYGLGALGAGVIDQRGTRRPAGNGCDLGSFELANFAVAYSLDVDTTNYQRLPTTSPDKYAPGVVEVGVRSVVVSELAKALNAPAPTSNSTVESSGVRNIGVRNIGVRNIGVRNIGVRNIGVRNIGVRNIGVRNIGVRNIGVRNIALQNLGVDTFINTIPLSEIPLLGSRSAPGGTVLVPEGWAAYLAGTQYDGLPLQSLTMETLIAAPPAPMPNPSLENITLEDLDLSNSVLGEIALRSAALAGVPLAEIPPPTGTTWCGLFSDLCARITEGELLKLDLLSVQLAGGDVDAADVATIDLDAVLRPAGEPVSAGVRNIGVRNIGVRNINIQNSGVRNIGVRNIGVRNIGVRNIDLSPLVDCTGEPLWCQDVDGNTFTLGELFEMEPSPINLDATVGDLLDLIGEGPNPADAVLGLTLADFLALFVPDEEVPWEQIDFEAAALQNLGSPAQPTFDYVAKVKVTGAPATSLAVTLNLPDGFLLAGRTGEKPLLSGGAISTPVPLPPVRATNGGLEFQFPANALAPGDYVLKVPVRAGVVTGEDIEATSSLAVVGPKPVPLLQAIASVTVVPVADVDGDGGVAGGNASPLTFDDLTIAHVASAGDVDIFSFTPTRSGARARVLLSNIPDGVDYDLSIYAPIAPPLRGTSADPAGTRKSLADIRYDLDPSDDIFPTDLADDINLDVLGALGNGYELRDISGRRSNTDEEVALPVVEIGTTYYVAVTSYLGDFSNRPYGIRVRLDGVTEPPSCRTSERVLKAPAPLPTFGAPSGTTNTLYLTNLEWLATDFPTQYEAITTAALATDDFVGSPVTDPSIIDVSRDEGVKLAYDTWALNPCDVGARNGVVRAIGKVLDGLMTSKIENIVILGGDGIVPMAAIRDLTGYSNEATAAQDVLTDGLNNPVAAALGAGFLLSDDPYATPAGISIRNAGQQLYVPDVSIGRLVETGGDILGQLVNFTTFKGRLDPETLPVTDGIAGGVSGAVTAYDFLTDGGQAVANNLRAGLGDLATSQGGVDLLGDTWDRDDYLALFQDGGPDIVSPNAHYDWEALLPAAPGGATYYTDDELVTTSDIDTLALPIERSLLFTMGCHAGLSVSDVQLGFTDANPALDWAETYAGGDNQWIAHTTYGYGDDEIVAYSERLAAIFALQLSAHILGGSNAPQTLGEAMVGAKQKYLATAFTLTPYDEKILQSWTYYGMPMYEIGGGSGGTTPPTSTGVTPATFGGSETLTGVGGGTVTPVSVSLNRTIGRSGPSNLNRVTTPNGTYYEVAGNTVTAQHRPVQPLTSLAVPPDIPAAGFLITELTSIDERPEAPLHLKPTVDLSGIERRVEPADGSFPANLQLVTTDNAGRQRLLLAAGQFQSGVGADPDTQRIFTGIKGQLYHSNSSNPSDGIGALIRRVETGKPVAGVPTDLTVTTEASAKRVVVLYQTGFNGQWASIDLTRGSGTTKWTGKLPANNSTRVVEFLIQTVDEQGDVGLSDNKVQNFFDSPVASGDEPTITATPPPGPAGYNNTPVTVTITADSPDDFDFVSLNGTEVANPTTNVLNVPVTADGVNVVFVRDRSGIGQFFTVVLDSTKPEISSPAASPTPWSRGPVTVDFLADDTMMDSLPFSSGVASITYTVGGAAEVTTVGASATASVAGAGITTVRAFATDTAGNRSEPVDVVVRIDQTAPTVTIAATPAVIAPSALWSTSTTVTLAAPFTATEAPIVIHYKIGDISGTEPPDPWLLYENLFVVNTEGRSVWSRATDDAGNVSVPAQSGKLQIDTTAPAATLTVPSTLQIGQVAFATKSCSDALSGIKDEGGCVLSGAVNPATGALDTTTTGPKTVTLTATDNAGNPALSTASYTVVQRVCELYDHEKAASAGSNYTIKLQICNAQGQPTADNGRVPLTAIAVYKVAANGSLSTAIPITPSFSGNSNSGFEFRFSAKDKQYVYNLATQRDWVTNYGAGKYVLGFVVGSFTTPRESTLPTNFARFAIG